MIPTPASSLERTAPRGVLAALCVTVTISYGSLYYTFAVLGPAISRRQDWSLTAMTAGFSAAALLAGVVGIPVGREIQRRGPRRVMVFSALLGAAGLLGLSAAPTLGWFIVALLICGTAGAGLFYAPAFAAITQWYGERRVQALTSLTLVAGFASTIFAPLVTELDLLAGWRWTYALLGGLLLATALPLHAVVLNHPWQPWDDGHSSGSLTDREIVRSRRFRLLAAAGALVTLSGFASLVALVPLLEARGLSSTTAAWVLGLGGAGQVLGRLFYPRLTRVLGVRGRATLIGMLVAAPIAVLSFVPGPPALLVALSVLAGLGRGLFTLVAATLVSDVWGPKRYASLNGVLASPMAVAGALGPFAGAAIASGAGGYPMMFAVVGAIALVGTALMACALRGVGRDENKPGQLMVQASATPTKREAHPPPRAQGRRRGPADLQQRGRTPGAAAPGRHRGRGRRRRTPHRVHLGTPDDHDRAGARSRPQGDRGAARRVPTADLSRLIDRPTTPLEDTLRSWA